MISFTKSDTLLMCLGAQPTDTCLSKEASELISTFGKISHAGPPEDLLMKIVCEIYQRIGFNEAPRILSLDGSRDRNFIIDMRAVDLCKITLSRSHHSQFLAFIVGSFAAGVVQAYVHVDNSSICIRLAKRFRNAEAMLLMQLKTRVEAGAPQKDLKASVLHFFQFLLVRM